MDPLLFENVLNSNIGSNMNSNGNGGNGGNGYNGIGANGMDFTFYARKKVSKFY